MAGPGRFHSRALEYGSITKEKLLSLKGATLIDFTGSVPGFEHHTSFDQNVVKLLRNGSSSKTLVVIDSGVMMPGVKPYVVSDQVNLTGTNPLIGPNDSRGERFPVVNGVYVSRFEDLPLSALPRGVAGGLKHGVVPTPHESEKLRSLGIDFCCYNLVPTMLVAAHAGWKVVALVVPRGAKLDESIEKYLRGE